MNYSTLQSIYPRRCLGIALCLLFACQAALAGESPKPKQFETEALPLLQTYCFKCHNASKQKGHVNFALAQTQEAALKQRKLWRKSLEQVTSKEMPPDDEDKQPTDAQRATLAAWMKLASQAGASGEPDPGPTIIRRLSWAEYDNTVRDLLGVEFDSAALVGATEDAGAGNTYGNLAAALDIAPAQMEKYFAAADKVLDRFFGVDLSSAFDGPVRERAERTRENLFGVKHDQWQHAAEEPKLPDGKAPEQVGEAVITHVLERAFRGPISDAERNAYLSLLHRGLKRNQGLLPSVRLALKAILVSPRFLYRIDSAPVSASASPAKPTRVSDFDLATRLSYFLWSSMPDEQLRNMAATGALTDDKPFTGETQLMGRILFGALPNKKLDNSVEQAFDGDPYTFYEQQNGSSDWIGIDLGEPKRLSRLAYAPMHYDPYRMEQGKFQASNNADFSGDVVDLLQLPKPPERGQITSVPLKIDKPYRYVRFTPGGGRSCSIAEFQVYGFDSGTALEQQVRRMLASPRASALTRNFAARWLELNKLAGARPSTEFFPDFQPEVRAAMYDETFSFFDHLRSDDRSVIDLLDANYTYLDETLAKYYNIPGVSGAVVRKVDLKPEYHRGGLLGMGSILAVTSHTYRTSPTLRGKYVLDVIFGTPPPPPPANAGMFKDESQVKAAKSFRELLSQHASDPSCAGCHHKLDPLGFSMENYNAAGVWRDDDHGKPLDNQGVLPTGEKLVGVAGLKQVVLNRKDDFVRNLTEQLLIYALGRDLDDFDEPTVKQIVDDVKSHDYKLTRLVTDVVKSYPFQYRRAGD